MFIIPFGKLLFYKAYVYNFGFCVIIKEINFEDYPFIYKEKTTDIKKKLIKNKKKEKVYIPFQLIGYIIRNILNRI